MNKELGRKRQHSNTFSDHAITPEVAQVTLVRASFRLSQGQPDVQKTLYEWAGVSGNLSDIEVPTELPNSIAALRLPKRHSNQNVTSGAIADELQNTWEDFVSVTKSPPDPSRRPEIIRKVYDAYIESDLKYVTIGRPERENDGSVKSDSEHDPHASWMRRYIILGEPTGVPAFDKLHEELRPVLVEAVDKGEIPDTNLHYEDYIRQNDIAEVVKQWQIYHPGEKYVPE
jgi:hypothetical protein